MKPLLVKYFFGGKKEIRQFDFGIYIYMHDHGYYHEIDIWYRLAISYVNYFVKIIIAMEEKGEVINELLVFILCLKIVQKRFQHVLHISNNIHLINII